MAVPEPVKGDVRQSGTLGDTTEFLGKIARPHQPALRVGEDQPLVIAPEP